eukprot:COSAG04_NODE_1313_length_7261_cov_9.902681_10_plen_113_part_00
MRNTPTHVPPSCLWRSSGLSSGAALTALPSSLRRSVHNSDERDYIQRTTGIEFLPSAPCCGSPFPFGPARYRLRKVRPDGIRPLAELSSSGAQLTVADVGLLDGAVLLLEPV